MAAVVVDLVSTNKCVYVHMCLCVCSMYLGTPGGQKSPLDPLELELQKFQAALRVLGIIQLSKRTEPSL